MRADRVAFERAGPHPRQRALVGRDAEVVGPEHHEPLDEAAIGDHAALQPRQRLGAERLLDDVERLRRRLGRTGRRLHRRILAGDLLRGSGQRQIAPLRRLRVGSLRRRLARALLRGFRGIARLLDLELIIEHLLAELRRREQARHFEQRTVRTRQLSQHETARIGGRVDQVAGRPAAGAKSKPVESNQRGLRITGHQNSLNGLSRLYQSPGILARSGMNPRLIRALNRG